MRDPQKEIPRPEKTNQVDAPCNKRSLPAQSEKPLAIDELNWSEMAFELNLDALARQIVLNSVVLSFQQNQLNLALQPELEVMMNQDMEEQIKKAIEVKLGVSLSLKFSSQPVLEVETPHQAEQRKQELERRQVILKIQQDPVVRQLNSLFGAELIEQSVRKHTS